MHGILQERLVWWLELPNYNLKVGGLNPSRMSFNFHYDMLDTKN